MWNELRSEGLEICISHLAKCPLSRLKFGAILVMCLAIGNFRHLLPIDIDIESNALCAPEVKKSQGMKWWLLYLYGEKKPQVAI